jgi:hypothetical protein
MSKIIQMPAKPEVASEELNSTQGFIDITDHKFFDGHTIYEYNRTSKAEPIAATIQNITTGPDDEHQKRLIINADCIYNSAKNLSKAKKKFIEMLCNIYDINIRVRI